MCNDPAAKAVERLSKKADAPRIKVQAERPAGYRELGEIRQKTEKAVQVEYHSWLLWIPKKALVKVKNGPYTAPAWAIDSAKDHPSARDNDNPKPRGP